MIYVKLCMHRCSAYNANIGGKSYKIENVFLNFIYIII